MVLDSFAVYDVLPWITIIIIIVVVVIIIVSTKNRVEWGSPWGVLSQSSLGR